MSTLEKLRQQTNFKPNAYFRMVIKETGDTVAYVSMTFEETDKALDEFNNMNKGKFMYKQITKEDFDNKP